MTGLPGGGGTGDVVNLSSSLALRSSDNNRRDAAGLPMHLLGWKVVVFGGVLLRTAGEMGDKNAPTERRRLSTAIAHRARMVPTV